MRHRRHDRAPRAMDGACRSAISLEPTPNVLGAVRRTQDRRGAQRLASGRRACGRSCGSASQVGGRFGRQPSIGSTRATDGCASRSCVGDRLAMARRIPEPAQPRRWPDHASGPARSPRRRRQLSRASASALHDGVRGEQPAVTDAAEAMGSTVTRHAGRGAWHQLRDRRQRQSLASGGRRRWLRELGHLRAAVAREAAARRRVPAVAIGRSALLLRHLWATDGCICVAQAGHARERARLLQHLQRAARRRRRGAALAPGHRRAARARPAERVHGRCTRSTSAVRRPARRSSTRSVPSGRASRRRRRCASTCERTVANTERRHAAERGVRRRARVDARAAA